MTSDWPLPWVEGTVLPFVHWGMRQVSRSKSWWKSAWILTVDKFRNCLLNFQISRTVLYKIVTERLGFQKCFAWWVPKIPTEHHKTQRMISVVDFLSRYDKGELLLNRVVTGNGTCVKYVNPETKEQLKLWAHSNLPS